MNTYIYIYVDIDRAGTYGIGTYINELKKILFQEKNIYANFVYLGSSDREFSIKTDKNICSLYIPDHCCKYNIELGSMYYRNSWYLIYPFIPQNQNDKIIFHLNYYKQNPLIEYIRRDFPKGKICFTVHYQNWCFLLKGNTKYFRTILSNKDKETKDEIEKKVLNMFEIEKNFFEKIDNVICLCNYTKEILRNDYNLKEDKLALVYNGLADSNSKFSTIERMAFRERINLKNQELLILFVGRLDDIKGVDILLNAYSLLLKENSNYHLLMAGEGNFEGIINKCENLWGKITFAGFVSQETLYSLYQIADIGIMPSWHEQCSYVAIEFMMHNVPLITSNSTGLDEMLDENKIEINEGEDSSSMSAKAIACLIENISSKEMMLKYAQLSRSTYLRKYNHECMKRKMISLYNNM